jgi:hypothetical protein
LLNRELGELAPRDRELSFTEMTSPMSHGALADGPPRCVNELQRVEIASPCAGWLLDRNVHCLLR